MSAETVVVSIRGLLVLLFLVSLPFFWLLGKLQAREDKKHEENEGPAMSDEDFFKFAKEMSDREAEENFEKIHRQLQKSLGIKKKFR